MHSVAKASCLRIVIAERRMRKSTVSHVASAKYRCYHMITSKEEVNYPGKNLIGICNSNKLKKSIPKSISLRIFRYRQKAVGREQVQQSMYR